MEQGGGDHRSAFRHRRKVNWRVAGLGRKNVPSIAAADVMLHSAERTGTRRTTRQQQLERRLDQRRMFASRLGLRSTHGSSNWPPKRNVSEVSRRHDHRIDYYRSPPALRIHYRCHRLTSRSSGLPDESRSSVPARGGILSFQGIGIAPKSNACRIRARSADGDNSFTVEVPLPQSANDSGRTCVPAGVV